MTPAEVQRHAAAGTLAAAIVAVPLDDWEARAERTIAEAWIAAMYRAAQGRAAGR